MSRSVVDLSDTGIWEDVYYAMIDVQSAHVYFEMGDTDKAQQIIKDYADSPLFTDTVYANIVARDFIIPYYEVACRLAARTQDRSVTKPLIDNFVACCETYGFYKSEQDTLLYLMENLPPKTGQEADAIYAIINRAYLIQTDMQTEEYTGLINRQLRESMAQKKMQDLRLAEQRHWGYRIVIYTSVMLLSLILLIVTIRQSVTDGLTKLRNRGAFNQRMWLMKKTHMPYGIIMIDIDNFKHLNDTYGHQTGDRVLQGLARILKSVQSRRFKCYRYGGEEFVVVARNAELKAIVAVGELVRKELEAREWDFGENVTISLGVASLSGRLCDHDVVGEADQNLYYSKEHGKNTTSYCQNGRVRTTREDGGSGYE